VSFQEFLLTLPAPVRENIEDADSRGESYTRKAYEAGVSSMACKILDGPCEVCGEPTSSLAANPGLWPIMHPRSDGTGICRFWHNSCVFDIVNGRKPPLPRKTDKRLGPYTVGKYAEHEGLYPVIGEGCIYVTGWFNTKEEADEYAAFRNAQEA
jgi:hypothetical protein